MKLRELFTDESKWCKGVYARDADGKSVPAKSKDACCWCLIGGMKKLGMLVKSYQQDSPVEKLYRRLNDRVIQWQDAPERTFAEVKALLDELDI